MRKAFITGLALVALFAAVPAVALDLSGTFIDDDGNIHEPAIQAIAAESITLGCGGRRYCPGQAVSRAEMATFLTRALNLQPLASGPFTDIAGNIHAQNINAIAAVGITLGCNPEGTRFCPNDTVLRDQMASFLLRGFQLAPQPSPYFDTAGNIHSEAIGGIATAGITLGCGGGRYCPSNPVYRDEMASFLARALDLPPAYVRLPLDEGLPSTCTKDGLLCTATVTLPFRSRYVLSEGFYNVQPFAGSEANEFRSVGTRVDIVVDGVTQSLQSVEQALPDGRIERRFEGELVLPSGSHQITAKWYWNSALVQTTVLNLTVR